MERRATKNKKQKSVLVLAVILALVIAAGGTFAWFTSQDEVTNRLTASNNYGVSITETFTPPEQWIPGQEITKEVSVINTGNIDAFVKLELSNALNLTTMGDAEAFDETDTDKFIAVSESERVALQAGGTLVYAADSDVEEENQRVESGEYIPEKSGLYVFKRVIEIDSDEDSDTYGQETYEYKGYYCVYDADNGNTYYAIEVNKDDFAASKAQTKTSSYGLVPVLDFTNAESSNVVTASYKGADESSTEDDIVINIKLAEDWSDNWTLLDGVFYYNSILAAGESTGDLVTALELSENVKNEAYLDFQYDLTVSINSVQITEDDEKTTAVNATWTKVKATVDAGSGNGTFDVTWEKVTTTP